MNPEHVKLSPSEMSYGQKELLSSQLNLLSVMKIAENFKKSRNEELALKVSLKTKIEEALSGIDIFEKLLPKPTMKESKERIPEMFIKRERYTLEHEIDEIKRKLARLQA